MSFPVHVIATTPEGTRAALAAARPFVAGQPVVVVVPSTQASAIQYRDVLATQYRRIANSLNQPIQLRICICRTSASVAQIIPIGATVLIGGAQRRWWPTREERMAAQLRRDGREVVFAEVGKEAARA